MGRIVCNEECIRDTADESKRSVRIEDEQKEPDLLLGRPGSVAAAAEAPGCFSTGGSSSSSDEESSSSPSHGSAFKADIKAEAPMRT